MNLLTFDFATSVHIPALVELMAAFNRQFKYPFDAAKTEAHLRTFVNNEQLGRIWMVRLHEQTIGYVVLTFGFSFEHGGRDAFIDELYISQPYHGKGVGKQILEFVESSAKSLGVNVIHLEVERGNERGNGLYTAMGYADNGRMLLSKGLSK